MTGYVSVTPVSACLLLLSGILISECECQECSEIPCCNCSTTISNTICCTNCTSGDGNNNTGSNSAAAGISILAILLLLETLVIGVIIGLVIWKRIKVAEFLYNLQLPKLRELPQLLREKWRPSSPPPDVYVERTVHNPTYDIEEGAPSTNVIADPPDTAKEPTELYEEIPNESAINQEGEFDVYDVPEALTDDQLEAYATTDVSGKELFDAYAVTDISQAERQCAGAYAITDVPEGKLVASGSIRVVSAEVHTGNKPSTTAAKDTTTPQRNDSAAKDTVRVNTSVIPPTKQTTPQREAGTVNKERVKTKTSLTPPAKQTTPQIDASGNKVKPPVALSTKPTITQKAISSETADTVTREKANAVLSAKRTAPTPPSSKNGTKDKTGVDAYAVSDMTSDAYKVRKIRVKFEDEERRRSKSYTGVSWEDGNQEEASTRSSVRGKPKPLPKKKGIRLKRIRERGASDSGVEGYSKLDVKSQYASLEPHLGNETNPKGAKESKRSLESYSHLNH